MEVGNAVRVVAREYWTSVIIFWEVLIRMGRRMDDHGLTRIEGYDAIIVRDLDTTQKGVVERVLGLNARVIASAVAVPHVGRHLRDGQARGHINKLQVDMHGHTGLALGDVRADVLAQDIVGADGRLGDQGAGIIAAEDGCLGRRLRIIERGRPVMVDSDIVEERRHVTLLVAKGLGRQPTLLAHLDGLICAALGRTTVQVTHLGAVLAAGQGPAGLGVSHVTQCHLALDMLIGDSRMAGYCRSRRQEREQSHILGHDARRKGPREKNETIATSGGSRRAGKDCQLEGNDCGWASAIKIQPRDQVH